MSDIQGSAVFAEQNGWPLRMRLDRWWSDEPRALVCMANPSGAGAEKNDPTIHRLIVLMRALPGIGGFTVVNWLPFVASDPVALHVWRDAVAWNDPETYRTINDDNHTLIWDLSEGAALRIVAWGNLVPTGLLSARILGAMSRADRHDLYAFGATQNGSPKHPLARGKHRIPDGTLPVLWRARRSEAA